MDKISVTATIAWGISMFWLGVLFALFEVSTHG